MHSSFYNLVLYAHEWCEKCKCVSMAVAKRINKKKTMSNFYGQNKFMRCFGGPREEYAL